MQHCAHYTIECLLHVDNGTVVDLFPPKKHCFGVSTTASHVYNFKFLLGV